MFAIGIRYLCGWSMATHPADRQRAEWPPHPDRVFMALAAAHFETDGGPEEYEALRRLSGLPRPSLSVSPARPRRAVTTFVPVNDDASPIGKKGRPSTPSGSLPIGRDRQPRSFPVAVPERDTAYLIWPEADLLDATRSALDRLCRKVGSLGHSASLVQMWVERRPPEPTLVPTNSVAAEVHLRTTGSSRLDDLAARYEAELRPDAVGWHGYGKPGPRTEATRARGTAFAPDLIILRRVAGQPLGLVSALQLTEALRGAVMAMCPDPPPEWVSGHDGPQGPPSRRPHLAFLPLADVGHAHAEGRLLGAALAIPGEGIPAEEQRRCLGRFLYREDGWPAQQRLAFGRLGDWDVILDDREERPRTLRPETWTAAGRSGPSERWASVTPVVLDRYPKAEGDAERSVRLACARIGLPEPDEVVTTPAPPFVGVPHARAFPPLVSGEAGARRFHVHVHLTFPEPVCGPVLLGAGRYRGYGLLRPWREDAR
jgi:CRISPR-associated protein Csb2